MSARGRPSDPDELVVQSTIISIVTTAFLGILLWASGIQIGLEMLAWLLIAFLILGVVTKRTTDYNVTFWILSLGLVFTVTDYLIPEFFLEPFTPFVILFDGITGIDVRLINGLQWLVLAAVITAVSLGASYRLTGDRKFIMPIVNAVSSDFARYIDIYATSARIIILLGLTAVIIIFQQVGFLLGDLGGLAGQSPYFVSNLFALLMGYLSLGGDLPIIGTLPLLGNLTPMAFIVLGVLAIAVAAASVISGTGPISQFVDRL